MKPGRWLTVRLKADSTYVGLKADPTYGADATIRLRPDSANESGTLKPPSADVSVHPVISVVACRYVGSGRTGQYVASGFSRTGRYVASGFSRTGRIAMYLVASAVCACSGPRPEAPPAKPETRAVVLPDLSSASPSVQSQLRERYAWLQTVMGRRGAPASEVAGAYGDMGKLLMAAEYLDAAEPCFLNALALEPMEMRWPYFLGHLFRFRNDPAKAVPWFEQTLRARPDHVPALVWLGEMHLAQNTPDAAVPLFKRALSLDPSSGAALYGLGRAALAKQEYGEAVATLERALAAAPKASRIHYALALAYRGRGDGERAEAHLKQRGDVEIPPSDPLMEEIGGLLQDAAAYEVRGAEALGKRQWAEAVTNLRKAILIAPANAFTRLNLGTALYLSGDVPAAVEQFETALRLSPRMAKAHFGLGVVREASGRDREAIEHFSAAVGADPAYVEARMQLADALRRTNRVAESLPHYAEIIRTSPGVSQALFGHAMALVRLARYQDARDQLASGVTSYPDQPGLVHALARVLAAAPDDRVRDGRRALTLTEGLWKQQQTPGLAETMAMALAELGRFEEAASWQRDARAAATRAGRTAEAAEMTDNLTLYERRRPCRTPWRENDPALRPRPGG